MTTTPRTTALHYGLSDAVQITIDRALLVSTDLDSPATFRLSDFDAARLLEQLQKALA